jgi:hypothetical protein
MKRFLALIVVMFFAVLATPNTFAQTDTNAHALNQGQAVPNEGQAIS